MFDNAKAIRSFALAGKATVTIESLKTGAHYTYKIEKAKSGSAWFVSVLSGPSNETDFTYMGMLFSSEQKTWFGHNGTEFRLTKKSRYTDDAVCVRAFRFFWRFVEAGAMPQDMNVRHSGACGRCGRTLTTPESLDRGIGPECANKLGMAA
jgi:hypothetical protein